jgi:hypothetical protein
MTRQFIASIATANSAMRRVSFNAVVKQARYVVKSVALKPSSITTMKRGVVRKSEGLVVELWVDKDQQKSAFVLFHKDGKVVSLHNDDQAIRVDISPAELTELLRPHLDKKPDIKVTQANYHESHSAEDLQRKWRRNNVLLARMLSNAPYASRNPNSENGYKSCSIFSKEIRGGLFNWRFDPLRFNTESTLDPLKFKPKGVGIIVDPDHPKSDFRYVSRSDMYSGHNDNESFQKNEKDFPITDPDGLREWRFNFSYRKRIHEVVHQILSVNLSTDNPFGSNRESLSGVIEKYGKKKGFDWSEAYGVFVRQGIIGILILDLSASSANYALDLLRHYPERAIVRYSYDRNELVAVDVKYLQDLADISQRSAAVMKKLKDELSKIFPESGVTVLKNQVDGSFKIIIDSATDLAKEFGKAGALFFEDIDFFKVKGRSMEIDVKDEDLAAYQDFFAEFQEAEKSLLIMKLSNQLFDLCPNSNYSMSMISEGDYDYSGRDKFVKRLSRVLNNYSKKDVVLGQFGDRQLATSEAIHRETICFSFLHPSNANIECVTFVSNGRNRCLFFDKTSYPPALIGEAFAPLIRDYYGEHEVGFAYRIALTQQVWRDDFKPVFDKYRGKIINAGASIYLAKDQLAINFSSISPENDRVLKRFKEFMGTGFVGVEAGEDFKDDVLAFHPQDSFNFCLKTKSENDPSSCGWQFGKSGEIKIYFQRQEHRDNFIRAFGGDILDEDGVTLFAIDFADKSGRELIIREEFVSIMQERNVSHGGLESLQIFVDLSEQNRVREINFTAMASDIKDQTLVGIVGKANASSLKFDLGRFSEATSAEL